MAKRKRKRIAAEKAERKRRKTEYRMVFIGGKMKRVRREPLINGIPVDEFVRRNDPLWLHQNEMWWEIPVDEDGGFDDREQHVRPSLDDLELPF